MGLDGDREERLGEGPAVEGDGVAGVVDDVAGAGGGEFGGADEVAGDGVRDGALRLAEGAGEGGDAFVAVLVGGVGGADEVDPGVGAQGAGVQAQQADPSDVGVAGDADDLGGERGVGVALGGGAGAFGGVGEGVRDEVEEFGGAEAVLAGGDGGVEGAGEDPRRRPASRESVSRVSPER